MERIFTVDLKAYLKLSLVSENIEKIQKDYQLIVSPWFY